MEERLNTRHVKSLDGIRGIAILSVMGFHFGYLDFGWIGVQIFFTLSGYLITTILLRSKDKPFRSFLGTFYWHRVLRIFPVLYLLLIVASFVFLVSGAPPSFKTDWLPLASFTVNLARLRSSDVGPWCVHIWSLGIEQQFYLVWPFLVFFLSKRGFGLTVASVIALTPLIRLWIFQYLLQTGHDSLYAGKAVYVLPVTQLDAFAAGAAIPTWALQGIPHAKRWFLAILTITAAAGVAVLAFAYFGHRGAFLTSLGYAMYLTGDYEYAWGYSLINLLSMLGIVCALQGLAPRHLIENRLIVWIGAISYGVYVYHIPMLLIGEHAMNLLSPALQHELKPMFFIVWVIAVIGISQVSYTWLERPVLRLKDYWQKS